MTGTDTNAENPSTPSPAPGWRDGESAPKDGTRVFAGIVRGGALEEVHIARWCEAINEDEVSCWWSEQDDDEITPRVWMPFVALSPTTEAGR